MKPKIRGWKEGIMKQDVRSISGNLHKKGEMVRYRKMKEYDEQGFFIGFQYHYLNQDNTGLVRTSDLLIT